MNADQKQSIETLETMVGRLSVLISKCRALGLDHCVYALETFALEVPKSIAADKKRLLAVEQQKPDATLATQKQPQVIEKERRLF